MSVEASRIGVEMEETQEEYWLCSTRLYDAKIAEMRNIPYEGAGHGSFVTEWPCPGHVIARFISDAIKSGKAVEQTRWRP